jgi:hypothetical protein
VRVDFYSQSLVLLREQQGLPAEPTDDEKKNMPSRICQQSTRCLLREYRWVLFREKKEEKNDEEKEEEITR